MSSSDVAANSCGTEDLLMAGQRSSGEVSAQVLTVQDAIVETFHAANRAGQPIKALAQDTRIAGSRLYECYEHRKRLWAEEVPVLVKATGNPLIVATIARACGGTYVPLPVAPGALASDIRVAADAMHEFGQVMQSYSEALADGRITEQEAEHIAQAGHEAIAAILALMQHADSRRVRDWRRAEQPR